MGEKQVLALTCLTPITDTKTRITQIFWSDHWVFGLAKPFLRMGVVAFLKQDGGMVNLQNEGLRYDPALIWIDDADKQAKWYQQLKREWAKSRAEDRAFREPDPVDDAEVEELKTERPPSHCVGRRWTTRSVTDERGCQSQPRHRPLSMRYRYPSVSSLALRATFSHCVGRRATGSYSFSPCSTLARSDQLHHRARAPVGDDFGRGQ